jgi:NAD(P)-dependent dehydrogenase (short-subunit alcohol dehydrogenase family)
MGTDTSSDTWAKGRTFVVTGGSSGMGAATALRLGRAGANVVIQGRDTVRLAEAAEAVTKAGGTGHAAPIELGDASHAGALVDAATERFGGIDGLVLSASLFDPKPLADASLDSLNTQWTVNVAAHFVIVQAAAAVLPRGSSVVFLSSTVAHAGFAGCSAYAATKGAIEALSRTLAVELAPQGIRVNTIAPGFVRTPMLQPHLDAIEGYEESLNEKTPSGRIGEAEEIAEIAELLLSDRAAYINGTVITADGGWTAQ